MTPAKKINTALRLLTDAHVYLSEVALLDEGVGVLHTVRQQRCALIVEQHLDPAFNQIKALSNLTEAEAVPVFLRQLSERLDNLERTSSDVATLLEAAFGVSLDNENPIRKTVTQQLFTVTQALQEHVRKLGK